MLHALTCCRDYTCHCYIFLHDMQLLKTRICMHAWAFFVSRIENIVSYALLLRPHSVMQFEQFCSCRLRQSMCMVSAADRSICRLHALYSAQARTRFTSWNTTYMYMCSNCAPYMNDVQMDSALQQHCDGIVCMVIIQDGSDELVAVIFTTV